ncbi:unnamed protein product, partial [marine sediment metagenome]
AVRSAEPGRNVHRCLALMKRAFIGIHKQEEPVRKWNPSAEKHLKQLESKKSLSDPDLVIVACLRDVYVRAPTGEPTMEPILDKLIDPTRNSRWRDWAYWQKARVIASKAWTWTGDLGTVVFRLAEKRRIGCLVDRYTSSLTIRGRAAKAFLTKHPDSYMADVMRHELAQWRWRKAAVAVRELVDNRWYTGEGDLEGFPLNKKQLELLTQAQANVYAAGKLFPKVFLEVFVAEDKLDRVFWEGGSTRRIPEYFRTILKVKGKQALSAEIRRWLATIPIPERRKAESRPATRTTTQPFAPDTSRKSVHLNPIRTRNKIIEENMRRLTSLRADAKFMSEDQEKAIGILATYRSTEAAPKLVEIIMVKRRARKSSSLIGGGRRTRLGKPNEYPAVAALVSIGLPSVWAIRDNLDTFSKAQPEVKRVELYAEVILAVFPNNLVRALGAEMK